MSLSVKSILVAIVRVLIYGLLGIKIGDTNHQCPMTGKEVISDGSAQTK